MSQSGDDQRFRSNFLAIVSHELNTPLMGIMGALQMLEENFPQEKEYIPILRKNAERMRERVNNLLELSRADAGALRVRLGEVDIENFIYLQHDLLKDRVHQYGFEFNLQLEGDLPKVCADAKRIGKVFESLVLNAMKFSSAKRPDQEAPLIRVRLALETVGAVPPAYFPKDKDLQTGLYIVTSISSSLPAIGEKPDHFEQLFEPFSPWRDVDTRPKEGMGIELALAREILLAHAGFIWASDAEFNGEGWVFRFAIPVLSREDEIDLIVNNRLFTGLGNSKVSLLLIQPSATDMAARGVKISSLVAQVQQLLFRSSDSLFTVPETGELMILMDDCDALSAVRVGERLVKSLLEALPHVAILWSAVTAPDNGTSAEQLLGAARSSWRQG